MVQQKVKLLSVTAGAFPPINGQQQLEYNVVKDIASARKLAQDFIASRMPVPVVVVLGATPAPPPMTSAFAASAADDAIVVLPEKYGIPPEVPVVRPVPPLPTGSVPVTWVVKLTPVRVPPSVRLPLTLARSVPRTPKSNRLVEPALKVRSSVLSVP